MSTSKQNVWINPLFQSVRFDKYNLFILLLYFFLFTSHFQSERQCVAHFIQPTRHKQSSYSLVKKLLSAAVGQKSAERFKIQNKLLKKKKKNPT